MFFPQVSRVEFISLEEPHRTCMPWLSIGVSPVFLEILLHVDWQTEKFSDSMMRIFFKDFPQHQDNGVLMPMQESITQLGREQVSYDMLKPRKVFECVIRLRTRIYLLIMVKATRLQWVVRKWRKSGGNIFKQRGWGEEVRQRAVAVRHYNYLWSY